MVKDARVSDELATKFASEKDTLIGDEDVVKDRECLEHLASGR